MKEIKKLYSMERECSICKFSTKLWNGLQSCESTDYCNSHNNYKEFKKKWYLFWIRIHK
jgi:hypothetical protein